MSVAGISLLILDEWYHVHLRSKRIDGEQQASVLFVAREGDFPKSASMESFDAQA
jgi:hypothetical protein